MLDAYSDFMHFKENMYSHTQIVPNTLISFLTEHIIHFEIEIACLSCTSKIPSP